VNAREKEDYLREYEQLKKKGKPFFPYAIMKDSVMFLVVAAVLITMSLVLAARVVLLLPVRTAARDQAAGTGSGRDGRNPDHLHGPPAVTAVLRP
jgi:hypothetical protein